MFAVSYFNGVKTFEENFLFPNLTSEEHWIAQAYYLDLYDMSPTAWDLPKDIVIDIPVQYRYCMYMLLQCTFLFVCVCDSMGTSSRSLAELSCLYFSTSPSRFCHT